MMPFARDIALRCDIPARAERMDWLRVRATPNRADSLARSGDYGRLTAFGIPTTARSTQMS